ncbi:MAG TPA: DNA alkylation repair protein [Methanocorpusculum sp.]|nr:DNA alkylation repair protein [Methanocorpusculum sp.]
MTDKYSYIKSLFEQHADRSAASSMAAYMKNQFLFYGITAPIRKELYNEFIKAEKKQKVIDWAFLGECYADDHREFQYLVYDYLPSMKKYVTYGDLIRIKRYITIKSWWDTVDLLCKVIGDVSLRDERVKTLMISWSQDENIWLKRAAIQHQMSLKDKTDAEVLEETIKNSLGSSEFFVNKAIGCALRDYAKSNPVWVTEFLTRYENKLSPLSRKEAGKYLLK